MKTFNSPVNFRFANALAAGASSKYGQQQFNRGVGVMIANAENGVVRLPTDVKGHVAFRQQAEKAVADQPDELTIQWGPALPVSLVAEARKRQAEFEARNKSRGPARTGKTAKKGGRAAYERHKREKSANSRGLREMMRGSSAKKS